MQIPVLMIAQDAGLSAALAQALEERGEYKVSVASTGGEALEIASSQDFDIVIVDMNLRGEYARNVIRGLRSAHPRLPVLAVPMNNDPGNLALQGMDLQGVLTRPVVASDLVRSVEKVLGRPENTSGPAPVPPFSFAAEHAESAESFKKNSVLHLPRAQATIPEAKRSRTTAPVAERSGGGAPGSAAKPTPPKLEVTPESGSAHAGEPALAWLEDTNRASQYLTRLSLETSARAALLTRGPFLLAYAGQFGQTQAGELTRMAHENWSRHGGRGALVRFVRLRETEEDCLLYSISAAGDIVLSMVFQAEAPIGMVRKQARQLVEALTRVAGPDPDSAASFRKFPGGGGESPQTAYPEGGRAGKGESSDLAQPSEAAERQAQSTTHPEGGLAPDAGLQTPQSLAGLYSSRNTGGLYRLHYTIIMAPKFARYRLEGELSARLQELMRHYTVAFHWRLNRLVIDPDHVALDLTCPPTIAPDRVARQLKQLTSERLFLEFPRLAQDDPSGDFWAPGYLLIGTGEAPAPQQVVDYLTHVRREQGLAE